jgi:hypothetical protein
MEWSIKHNKLTILLHSRLSLVTKQTPYRAPQNPVIEHNVAFRGKPLAAAPKNYKQTSNSMIHLEPVEVL